MGVQVLTAVDYFTGEGVQAKKADVLPLPPPPTDEEIKLASEPAPATIPGIMKLSLSLALMHPFAALPASEWDASPRLSLALR